MNRLYNTKSRFFKTWKSICRRVGKGRYKNIFICEKWRNFDNFYDDMFKSYCEHTEKHGEKDTTIDRVNNNLGYSPENCRWATMLVQGNNRSNSRHLTFGGRTQSVAEWARELKISRQAMHHRIDKGWSLDKALTVKGCKRIMRTDLFYKIRDNILSGKYGTKNRSCLIMELDNLRKRY